MHEQSVELLNKAIGDELTAVHQYMYFHFHCDDQGYDLLAALFKQTAIEEMLHAERLAERILFLKADVEMRASGEVTKIHDVARDAQAGKGNGGKEHSGLQSAGPTNVPQMPTPYPRSSSRTWWLMKNATTINTTSKWRTWISLENDTWHCSRSSEARAG